MNVISFRTIWKAYLDAIDLRDRGIGYVAAGGGNVLATATGVGTLGVSVAASSGVGFIVNSATTFTTYAGGAITLAAANATNPRVDIVYFSSAGALAKTDGTAAAIVLGVSGPVPPAWPAGCCPLAICLVPATATDFTTGGYVMDVRCFRSLPTGTASATTFWRGDNQWAAPAGTGVTSVTGTAPVASTGGTTPAISVPAATATVSGLVPTPPNNTTTFLRGDATFATPSGAAGGTPAIVLGTANAAGVAATFIRDDDTILAFDATVPAAIGTAAAGAATVAGRRDHVHPTGAGTPTTMIIGNAAVTGTGPAAPMSDHQHGITNPLTTAGDLWYGGAAGAPGRLAVGAVAGYAPITTGTALAYSPPLVPPDCFLWMWSPGLAINTTVAGTGAVANPYGGSYTNAVLVSSGGTSGGTAGVRRFTMNDDTISGATGVWKLRSFDFICAPSGLAAVGTVQIYFTNENATGVASNTANHFGIRLADAVVNFTTADGTTEQTTAITAFFANNTNAQVGITFDGTTARCYVNGTLRATHATNVPLTEASKEPVFRIFATNTAAPTKDIYVGIVTAVFQNV